MSRSAPVRRDKYVKVRCRRCDWKGKRTPLRALWKPCPRCRSKVRVA